MAIFAGKEKDSCFCSVKVYLLEWEKKTEECTRVGMFLCFSKASACFSVIMFYQVRREDKNVKRTVLKSVVGTLDLSIRFLLQGETFPGVQKHSV